MKKAKEAGFVKQKKMKKIAKKMIRIMDSIVDWSVLTIFLLFLLAGFYSIWDAEQVYQAADRKQYEMYKPTSSSDDYSFQQLQEKNSEVFAWITVYGTNIDYPVVKAENNEKYLNQNVLGEFALSGSLFADYRSADNFKDFNTIIYGHHMDREVMFGEIQDFKDETFFSEHLYGNIYFSEKNHGIRFFAFLEVDAYDGTVYRTNVPAEQSDSYLNLLIEKATNATEISVDITDKIILLSTCTTDSTNGRQILVGKITNEIFEDSYKIEKVKKQQQNIDTVSNWDFVKKIPIWVYFISVIIILLICMKAIYSRRERGKHEKRK